MKRRRRKMLEKAGVPDCKDSISHVKILLGPKSERKHRRI